MNKLPVLALALLLAACGGNEGIDLAGMYQVVTHTRNDASCDAAGPADDEYPYFQIKKDSMLGSEFLLMDPCESELPASCEDGGLFFALVFSIPVDDGWEGKASYSTGSGDPCTLTYQESSASMKDGTLTIEKRQWSEEVTVPEDQCDTEEADARGKSMPCTLYEVIEGNPIGQEG
jgi:hypothetical protein